MAWEICISAEGWAEIREALESWDRESLISAITNDKFEAVCAERPGSEKKLVAFYQQFLPRVPKIRMLREPEKLVTYVTPGGGLDVQRHRLTAAVHGRASLVPECLDRGPRWHSPGRRTARKLAVIRRGRSRRCQRT